MNKKRLMILPLYLTALSCKYDALLHTETAEASATVMVSAKNPETKDSDLKILSENILRIINADLKNTYQGKLLMGASQSFSYPGLQLLLEQNESCTNISLSKRSESVTESFLDIDCPKIKGTKEVRNIKTEDTRAFESSSSIMIYDKEATYELRERSALNVAKEGTFRLEKEYSDLKKEALSSSEIAGSLNYDIQEDGKLEFDGSASLFQEGSTTNAFIMQGHNLHYATCGIDQGNIEFTAGKKKLTITFQACNRYTSATN
jgi:hypothetical protein